MRHKHDPEKGAVWEAQTNRIDFAFDGDIVTGDVIPHRHVLKEYVVELSNWPKRRLKHSRNITISSYVIFDDGLIDGERSILIVVIEWRHPRDQ